MQIGDLVNVETKFHGKKKGIVVEKIVDSYGVSWEVHIPNHWTATTVAHPLDIELVSSSACNKKQSVV